MPTGGASGLPYLNPFRRRPPSMERPGRTPAVRIRGIEVVQVAQDLANSVPLIVGKATVVRIYADPASFGRAGKIHGEIAWSRGGGGEAYLRALRAISIDPARPLPILDQRGKITSSLNFLLPAEALAEGRLRIRLSRIYQPGGSDLAVAAPAPVEVDFTPAPPLRIRVIGLRYKDGERQVAPAAIHFAYLKSYLLRAYPIAAIEWSQIVVDTTFEPPFDDMTSLLANAQIAAQRSQEVDDGVDPRTHYFGLVDDGGGFRNFMRGRAFTIPDVAQPDVVASAPAGVPNGYTGDNDASYADWYGAHELGHTFGRSHPGFPPDDQDASDAAFPYANGCISPADGQYVGFDVGDASLGLPMMALPGLAHHDVMTYAVKQWLSPYTYQAILTRLIEEDALQ